MAESSTYADAGVDIELGDDASRVLYEAAKQTWANRKGRLGEVLVPVDDFSGLRAIDPSGLPEGTLMNISFDGVGTKMELAERTGNHKTIAYDLFAMVCDDAVVRGAEPVLVGSILDVNSLSSEDGTHLEQVRQLAEGYIGAAKEADVVVVNGEIAELGARVRGYGPFNYNWGAAVVWFGRKDRMFTGREVQEGDSLVGLREGGFRSNGLSLVRKIMQENRGDRWHETTWCGGNIAELVLTPSRIYSAAVVDMFGGFNGGPKVDVHGVAHITGGGLPGKLGRVLEPSGLGAMVTNPFQLSSFMKFVQELGGVSDREAYRTWNMGQGMVVITSQPDEAVQVAGQYGIDAQYIGEVVDKKGIAIRNMGAYSSRERTLIFD